MTVASSELTKTTDIICDDEMEKKKNCVRRRKDTNDKTKNNTQNN